MTLLAAIIAALAGLPILKQLIDVVNGSLDLTKKVREDLFHDSEKALQQPDSDEHAVERARAAADLLRSYALFGFLEYLLWLGKALVLLNVLAQWFRLMDRYLPPPRVRD